VHDSTAVHVLQTTQYLIQDTFVEIFLFAQVDTSKARVQVRLHYLCADVNEIVVHSCGFGPELCVQICDFEQLLIFDYF
jgi:hypothetical protein